VDKEAAKIMQLAEKTGGKGFNMWQKTRWMSCWNLIFRN
jgi:hypothetical protein